MNNTEAKFILNAYRPGGRDAGEAGMVSALAQAKGDPALGAWFAREQAHGAAVAAKLRDLAPPSGLHEAILAGGRMSGRQDGATSARRASWGCASGVTARPVTNMPRPSFSANWRTSPR